MSMSHSLQQRYGNLRVRETSNDTIDQLRQQADRRHDVETGWQSVWRRGFRHTCQCGNRLKLIVLFFCVAVRKTVEESRQVNAGLQLNRGMVGQLLSLDGLSKCVGVEVDQHDFLTTIGELSEVDVVAVSGSEQADTRL